ncbi:MAG TPA: methyltransferase [Actinocrinis sp.]|uniref:methyltransferase n=1 Tax=Actinocrinis sp. TaxID=1920516 RepID=UPI002DDCA1DE|nr:methyltransferase [Actinocrinis sp.]HEV2344245.1 methyltransferase [Actinocrinis sp.]
MVTPARSPTPASAFATHPAPTPSPSPSPSPASTPAPAAVPVPVADISALFDIYQSGVVFHCLCAVTRLGVADALAAGPRPVGAVAAEVGADEDALRRVLTLLAGHRFVTFDAAGDAALTGPGLLLSSRHPASLSATFATLGISDVAHALTDVVRTGRAAAPQVLGAGFWDYLGQRPAEQAVFSAAMAEQAQLLSLPCVDLLSWPAEATIVDVAGGTGALLAAVLQAAPDARGILVDQPSVLNRARERMRDAGVADRCDVSEGDLFGPPPKGDLYLLSRVLHDWNDEHVVRILRAVAAGAAPAARLRVFEDLLPEGTLPSPVQSWSDVVMMALYDGARERTLSQFRTLFDRAGWRLERAVAGPPGMNVIEAQLLS